MLKDRYSFIALFTYETNGISIEFPDLPGCCPCADTMEEAIKNAEEALGLHIFGMEVDEEPIPDATPITELHKEPDQVTVRIEVFMPPVRERLSR